MQRTKEGKEGLFLTPPSKEQGQEREAARPCIERTPFTGFITGIEDMSL